jgi:amino acid adenylation domain-containing protein
MSATSSPSILAAVEYDPFAGAALSRVVPTTEPQREVWLACQLGREASLAYNESVSLRLHGALDIDAMRGAIADVLARHEALRATVSADGNEIYIAATLAIEVPLLDLARELPQSRERAHAQALHDAVEEVFSLEQGPLIRARILRNGESDHTLILSAHHIVCDGWSFGVLVSDLAKCYTRRCSGTVSADVVAESFSDYAVAQNARVASSEHAADEAFWVKRFTGPVPVLDLPTDRPRAPFRTFASHRVDHLLDADLAVRIRQLGARHGASFFASLLAGFGATLARIAGTGEVVIGVPFAGQSVADRHGLIGHCVNLLPLRVAVDAALPLAATIGTTQTAMLDAFEHPEYTFGSLLKKLSLARDPSRLPLVSVMFNLDQALDPNAPGFPGVTAEFSGNPRSFENFELFVNAVQVQGALRLECQYNTDLFDEASVRRWLQCYETFLRGACDDPERAAGLLPFTSMADSRQMAHWNDTRTDFGPPMLVHELVDDVARRLPERVALRCGALALTYGELVRQADGIATQLQAMGVGRGSLVGLHVPRDLPMVAAMLGVLRAGAGYVPLDPAYPRDRLRFMAEDAGLTALVTHSILGGAIEWPEASTLFLDRPPPSGGVGAGSSMVNALPGDPAYVIYTSGSTGKPKGVQVGHSCVVNFLKSMILQPGLAMEDRVLAVTTLSFDIAVTELLLPLTIGAEIVLATREEANDGASLCKLIDEHRVTMLQATPATWRMLIDAGWQGSAGFKALCGGESLSADLASQLLRRTGELWNMYGPTETTVWSTCQRIAPDEAITIGRPIANTSVWILDERLETCPIGVPGEICIGGDGVTQGYLHRPDLTAERFVPDPFAWSAGSRLYRTGDRGRLRADGRLEHLGRNDFQVKVRGYRIELGEIEAALLAFPGVTAATVIAREDRPGDVRLVAYIVAAKDGPPSDLVMLDHLRSSLPDYMLPQHFVVLPAIPVLPNGKIDRRALPAPAVQLPQAGSAAFVPPEGELERAVVRLMESVLDLDGLGMTDDFFRLGGHSLLAARLMARVNREFGTALPMRVAFQAPTAKALAAVVDLGLKERKPDPYGTIVHQPDQTRGPLTRSQARIRFVEEMNPGGVAYNTPSAHRLRGALDVVAFQTAFDEVVARQAALRTVITASGSAYEQRVLQQVALALPAAEDLSTLPPAQRETEVMRRMDALIAIPFDLATGPLFVARLFRLDADEFVFFFMAHHIIWDGWSFDLLHEELARAYEAALGGTPNPLAPLALTFVDYAHWSAQWLQGPACSEQLAYWRNAFAGSPVAAPVPADLPRRPGMSGRGATEWISIDRTLVDRLHGVARGLDTTLNMVMLAAFAGMLHTLVDGRALTFGIPVRGRPMSAVEPIMGFFNNLLPLRFHADPSRSFSAWVQEVKRTMLDAFAHQDVPFELLVQEIDVLRESGAAGFYQALFSFQDARERVVDWGGLKHDRIPVFQPAATEDLGLWLMEVPEGLTGGVTYNADLFHAESAALLRRRYVALLERIAAGPDAAFRRLFATGDDEYAALEASREDPASFDLIARLRERARVQPDALAVRWNGEKLNRVEFIHQVDRIAHLLAVPGSPVGRVQISVANPVLRLAAQCAVWHAGGTCIVHAGPTQGGEAAQFSVVIADSPAESGAVQVVRRVDISSAADSAAPVPVDPVLPEDSAIEVLSSAGALSLSHGTVSAMVDAFAARIGDAAAGDWVLWEAFPELTVLMESMAALSAGGSVTLAASDLGRDGDRLGSVLKASAPTVAHLPPGAWRAALDAWWTAAEPFVALIDADETSAELADAITVAGCRVLVMYRPPDVPFPMALGERVERGVPINAGRALRRSTVYVGDAAGQPLPLGAQGWVMVRPGGGSAGMATGDQGRIGPDGVLALTVPAGGRVPLWGHRIDLAAIEAAASRSDADVCVATVHEDRPGDRQLDIYLVPGSGSAPDADAIRSELQRSLPIGVSVRAFKLLSSVPRLPDGRPDRSALVARVAGGALDRPLPSTPTELALAEIWQTLLGVAEIELGDNFFDLGGSSLLAMQAIEQFAQRNGKRITARRYVFETLGQLALAYDTEAATSDPAAAAAAPERRGLFSKIGGLMRRGR